MLHKILIWAGLSFATLAGATPLETLELTNMWNAVYCETIEERPAAECWGTYPTRIKEPYWGVNFSASAKKPEKQGDTYNGLRIERTEPIPADWAGKRIWLELPAPVRRSDAVIFVNDSRAGDILRPGGTLEITRWIHPGEDNAIAIFFTQSGAGTERGETKFNRWEQYSRGPSAMPRLYTTDSATLIDVFAKPSVRDKKLVLEVEIDSALETPARLEAHIKDADGRIVKTLSQDVSLPKGTTTFTPEVAWDDAHLWAFGDGYLYTCETRLTVDGKTEAFPAFRFGFRELWREGKELYMNGHPIHFRTCYSYGTKTRSGMQFLQSIGYNVLAVNHDPNGFPLYPLDSLHISDELGLGMILSCGAPFNVGTMKLHEDEDIQRQYLEFVRPFHRRARNHPSLVACYVNQMIICAAGAFPANIIGQTIATGGHHSAINKARDLNRIHNPNILYYSHGDGPNGDISSGNLYFNWTPPQEIDEWMSEWSRNGVYPWHGSEFEVPYTGCWWYGGGYNGTEHMAREYGDEAYAQEPLHALENARALSALNRTGHGASTELFDIETDWPLYYEWRAKAIPRIMRYWRGYGLNGGLIWFNIAKGYGMVTNELGWLGNGPAPYDIIPEPFDPSSKPAWVNPNYDIFKAANRDFCGYIAGTPDQVDKSHAFYAGESVQKTAAFIWDGFKTQTFTADWRVTFHNEKAPFAHGHLKHTLTPGQIVFEPFSFTAPNVSQKRIATLELVYNNGDTDSLQLEFYPPLSTSPTPLPKDTKLALFDPSGESEPMLQTLGFPYTKIDAIAEAGDATHILIGRHALDLSILGLSTEQLAHGTHILILAQSPAVWTSLGFDVQDAMARDVFLRDKTNPAFANISPEMLRYWRGTPDYGPLYKPVMSHSASRGPRGSRRHTVAGLVLKVPERAGYRPLIDAHFDLNHSALLRFEYDRGSITACTLDFEGRIGSDPAATSVAHAVLTDFLSQHPTPSQPLMTLSDDAQHLAETLGFATTQSADLLLVGHDNRAGWDYLRQRAEKGATVFIYNNDSLAQHAGFTLEPRHVYRAPQDATASPLFRTVTPAMFRWHDALKVNALTANPKHPATLYADGLLATMSFGKGRVVFCQIDPYQLANRYATKPNPDTLAADREWLLQLTRHYLETLGAPPKGSRDGAEPRWLYWNTTGCDIVNKSGVERSGTNGFFNVIGPSTSGACRNQSTWANALNLAQKGHTILLFNCVKIAEDAGFQLLPQHSLSELDPATLGVTSMTPRPFAYDLPVHLFDKAPNGFTIEHNGWTASGTVGNGRIIFCQLNPLAFEKVLDDWDRIQSNPEISTQRTLQLFSRLLLNLGARPNETIAKRALTRAGAAAYQPLGAMYVLGPFATQDWTHSDLMNKSGNDDAQAMALAGDFNPNILFPLPQGGTADWRPILIPDRNGSLNLADRGSPDTMQVYYAICPIQRETDAPALLRFGSEFRCRLWCNGTLILNAERGVDRPLYEVRLPLHKGENFLALKLASGHQKGRLWGLLQREKSTNEHLTDNASINTSLYLDLLINKDPDSFAYW